MTPKSQDNPDADAAVIWSAALDLLRGMLKTEIFALWFAPIRLKGLEGETLTLSVRDEFCEVWLRDNYMDLLRSVVSRAAIRPMHIEFVVEAEAEAVSAKSGGKPPSGLDAPEEDEGSGTANSQLSQLSEVDEVEGGLETSYFTHFDKKGAHLESSSGNGLPAKGEPAEGSNGMNSEKPAKEGRRSSKLMPGSDAFDAQNTFDSFVVGNNNQFAYSAAQAVAKNPGKSFNPLFLFGGVGLGKTHLLQAIGHHVISQRRNPKVAYLSCEKFTNEFIDALQSNSVMKFRRRYRLVDILLVDDIQFLAGKERIQEEFFHTFNTLHESRKQIVLTCDRPANEIKGLEDRLISRFEWGQTADLQPPDVETRTAILRKKSKSLGLEIGQELIDFLAMRIRTNVRRLEGALIRVASYGHLTGNPITLDTVETLLREILDEEGNHTITIESIQKLVAEQFDIRMADMTSKRRPESIAFPRQVAMYLARQLTKCSLSVIGEAFGGRDHGTVLHACRLVKDRMDLNENIRAKVSLLERQLTR